MAERSYGQLCALARALDVIGDRWSLLVVRNLLLGPRRWSELRADLPGVAKNLLSGRLAQLETDGILERADGAYRLTEMGRDLERPLFALSDWGERYVLRPRPGDTFRLRYLMTSVRRRLQPGPAVGWLQLYIDEEPFALRLGAAPTVVQGTRAADATLRVGVDAWRARLFAREPLDRWRGRPDVEFAGDPAVLTALDAAWPPVGGRRDPTPLVSKS